MRAALVKEQSKLVTVHTVVTVVTFGAEKVDENGKHKKLKEFTKPLRCWPLQMTQQELALPETRPCLHCYHIATTLLALFPWWKRVQFSQFSPVIETCPFKSNQLCHV